MAPSAGLLLPELTVSVFVLKAYKGNQRNGHKQGPTQQRSMQVCLALGIQHYADGDRAAATCGH